MIGKHLKYLPLKILNDGEIAGFNVNYGELHFKGQIMYFLTKRVT